MTTTKQERIDSIVPELSGISQTLMIMGMRLGTKQNRTPDETAVGDALTSVAMHIERITDELDTLCAVEM